MRQRDISILNDLRRFRCLSRDHIAELYFSHTKQPITQANLVLKRLRRDGHIKCTTNLRKYVYFLAEQRMRPDSAKIGHFLAIADFYIELRRIQEPREFIVEEKKGNKGMVESDAFMIWRGLPWYLEVQRSYYTHKKMNEKMNLYEKYYIEGNWEAAHWQPANKKIFPMVWISGKGKYNVGTRPFRVVQGDIDDIVRMMKPS